MCFIYWIKKKTKINLTKTGLKFKEKIYGMGITIINITTINQSNFEEIPWS